MKKVKGRPITGAMPEYSKKAPMIPNAKDTSLDEQRFISQAPTPFKDRNTPAQIPAGQGAAGAEYQPSSGVSGQSRKYSPQRPSFPSKKGPFVSVPNSRGAALFSGSQKPMGGTMQTTDPMAGQHGSSVGSARSKRNRSFYGE